MIKTVVGIDPAITNTGIVILDSKTAKVIKAVNTQDYHEKKAVKGQYRYKRLQDISDIVLFTLRPYEVSAIYYEDYSFNSVNLAFTTGELGGILRTALIINFNTLTLIEPTKLKKFATGRGDADKEQIIARAKQEANLGKKVTSDICDAYFLAKMAFYKLNPFNAPGIEPSKDLLRIRLELGQKSEENLLC